MSQNRVKNLLIIFICIILIFATFVLKRVQNQQIENKKESSYSEYLNEKQLEKIDDSLYEENALDY